MELIDKLKNIIHEISVSDPLYSGLYFSEEIEIETINFSFNFNHHNNIDGYEEDMKFLLDNIISKIFELNDDINHISYHRTKLGNYIHYNSEKIFNPFIVKEYLINDNVLFGNIDEFINSIEIDDNGIRYQVNWKIPILKLDKNSYSIL